MPLPKGLKGAPQRFTLQLPLAELEDLEMTAKRLRDRKARGLSVIKKKDPSASKIVRVALRQLLGSTTTEQLEELIETTDL
jgi:hypothetical protein